jgi:hypothetical protein
MNSTSRQLFRNNDNLRQNYNGKPHYSANNGANNGTNNSYVARNNFKNDLAQASHNQQYANFYNDEYKQQLIDYIYSTIDISRFKYKILVQNEDLQQLDVQKYKVSANFTGPNCLLIFIKIKDKYFSCLLNRKTLSYNPSQINMSTLSITKIRVALDESIYSGSIFDGIYTPQKTFIITDCYYFRGKDLTSEQLMYKLINVRSYLDATYKQDNTMNTIKLNVNKLYDLSEIDKLLNDDIPKTKNMEIRGLTFHPDLSGTKLIFIFSEFDKDGKSHMQSHVQSHMQSQNQPSIQRRQFMQNSNLKQNNNEDKNNEQNEKKKKVTINYICKTNEPVFAVLEMRKTNIPDVYKLYAVEKTQKDGRPIYKSKKLGMADIATTKCSHMCRNIMGSAKPSSRIYFNCKFIQDKNKWAPIDQNITSKMPTSIHEIETYMDLVENECSDSD